MNQFPSLAAAVRWSFSYARRKGSAMGAAALCTILLTIVLMGFIAAFGGSMIQQAPFSAFLIFLILIHVRMKVKDKAFWTAVIAIVGFEVMMFNWIVVNFIITGLHSYA